MPLPVLLPEQPGDQLLFLVQRLQVARRRQRVDRQRRHPRREVRVDGPAAVRAHRVDEELDRLARPPDDPPGRCSPGPASRSRSAASLRGSRRWAAGCASARAGSGRWPPLRTSRGERVPRRPVVVDRLADGDERRQGVADDGQAEEAEPRLREAGQLERQRRHLAPRRPAPRGRTSSGSAPRTCGPCRSAPAPPRRSAAGVVAVALQPRRGIAQSARRIGPPRRRGGSARGQSMVVEMLLKLLTVSPQPPSAFWFAASQARPPSMRRGVRLRASTRARALTATAVERADVDSSPTQWPSGCARRGGRRGRSGRRGRGGGSIDSRAPPVGRH